MMPRMDRVVEGERQTPLDRYRGVRVDPVDCSRHSHPFTGWTALVVMSEWIRCGSFFSSHETHRPERLLTDPDSGTIATVMTERY